MGARFLLTGVQLGMLVGIPDAKERKKIVDKITDVQFIDVSDKLITEDVKKYRDLLLHLEEDILLSEDREDIKLMKERHKKEIEYLRKNCKHKKLTDWMEQQWAPGHSTGKQVKLCEYCEKVMETK